jgi:large subunit ribosomal protein L17
MRHKKLGRQFGRDTSHRKAMFRALAANLVLHERIETTDAKAKELRRVAERLITRAVRLGSVGQTPADKLSAADQARRNSTKRHVGRFLQRFATKTAKNGESTRVDLLEKLLVDLGARYKDRPGGYTRIIKIGRRRGDNAPMSFIELVGSETAGEAKKAGKAEAA